MLRNIILIFSLFAILVLPGCVQEKPQETVAPVTTTVAPPATVQPPSDKLIALGGMLYDKWWKEIADAVEPTEDQALWSTQTINTRSGKDTWRCKECHGWDYKGIDGAYASGSHKTGFPGVYTAAQTKTVDELVVALKGQTNPNHDFSSVMSDEHLTTLAGFLKYGIVDMAQYIDYDTKTAKNGDVVKGKELYENTCSMCHGADGKMINFGSDEKPKYLGAVVSGNPWETLHKVRAGQPGTAMSSSIVDQWAMQDEVDVLAYTKTLPE
ncbi:MAG: cytochrome c [Candidatus Hydrothermarchaeaceae archaeon]